MESNTQSSPVNMLDAVNYLSAAWDAVTPKTIENCFKKAGFVTGNDDITDDEAVVNIDQGDWKRVCGRLENSNNFESYIDLDNDVLTSDVRDLQDIIQDVTGQGIEEVEDGSDDEADDNAPDFGGGNARFQHYSPIHHVD